MNDKIKILYIDDYDLDRELVKDSLEKEHRGFQVIEASNKQEFETLLKTREFDAVLSDFNIAGFEGLQVLKAVRAHNPKIPVIIVTGTGSEEIAVKAMQQGASDYVIKKPSHIRRLPQTIFAAIEKQTLRKQRGQARTALKESEELFRNIAENSLVGIYIIQDGIFIYVNPKFAEIFGYSVKECLNHMHFERLVSPEDLDTVKEHVRRRISGQSEAVQHAFQGIKKDGVKIHVEIFGSSIHLNGKRVVTGTMLDITARKQAEEEKEKLKDQLVQAQKMESVGRLAGGVAHDYNNALSVILGYTELAMADADPQGPLHSDLNQVLKAGRRAADITRQLLAFARKQTIAPRVLDLNQTVESMLKMIRRLIGEDIDLVWLPGKSLTKVMMDPTQIDQILANLCINSRDAINGVGRITIETAEKDFDQAYCTDHLDFVPGQFVMLAISDNGCGMKKAILNHIFEPFFTTKDVDKGTGLGLSTVFGIVKQNNGFINVYSEPGKGTSVRIYLRRHKGSAVDMQNKSRSEIPRARGETILLVEDDLSILKLAEKILNGLNYTVLIADTPQKAMSLAKSHASKIHLLITDVIMPEMNGLELSKQLQSHYPGLKCIFMSGYTANAIAHHGVLDDGVHFIQKPFSKIDLATIIRKALDQEKN